MNNDGNMQMGGRPDDPLPVSPGPLDPQREPGIEELPDNEGERPLDDEDAGLDSGGFTEETDSTILNRQQDPR